MQSCCICLHQPVHPLDTQETLLTTLRVAQHACLTSPGSWSCTRTRVRGFQALALDRWRQVLTHADRLLCHSPLACLLCAGEAGCCRPVAKRCKGSNGVCGPQCQSPPISLPFQAELVERFVVVHGQIILNQFKNFPKKSVANSAFVTGLKGKMELRRHCKLYLRPKPRVRVCILPSPGSTSRPHLVHELNSCSLK